MSGDLNYGAVQFIDGRAYVGGGGPEAQKAREREQAKARQREQQEAREQAERERRAAAEERYGPMLEAWPSVRAELTRRQQEAEERLRVALVESPVFGALLDVMSAQRAAFLGGQAAGSARSEITRQPFTSAGMSPRPPDLLDIVRRMAEESGAEVLGAARAVVADAGDGEDG